MAHNIEEDISGYCDCCASGRQKPKPPTIVYTIPVLGHKPIIVSLCEAHLVEGAEKLQSLKKEGDNYGKENK